MYVYQSLGGRYGLSRRLEKIPTYLGMSLDLGSL